MAAPRSVPGVSRDESRGAEVEDILDAAPVAALVAAAARKGLVVTTMRHETDRRRVEAELFRRATHDELTGVANRSLLVDRLAQSLGRLARKPGEIAVLFVDLDRFKAVNDSRGHAAGDAVLRAVADALVAAVRPSDTVARVGGDEFVVLCDPVAGDGVMRELAERVRVGIRSAVSRLLGDDANAPLVTASVGVATASSPVDTERLLDAADAAMYEAKGAGGDRVGFAR